MIINTWSRYGWTEPVQVVTRDQAREILSDPAFIVWIAPGIEILLCDYCRRTNKLFVFIVRPMADRCQYCGADLDEGYRILGRRNEPGAPIVFIKIESGGSDGI